MLNWHLLMTKPRDDARAHEHLANQGFEVFRPLLRHLKLCKGRQVAVVEPLFPRYMFIHLDDCESQWSVIRSTRGVQGLVRFTEMPAVVPEKLIHALRKRTCDGCLIDQTNSRQRLFKGGERVEIISGPFRGIQAIVRQQDSDERVVLLLTLLGAPQALNVPLQVIRPL